MFKRWLILLGAMLALEVTLLAYYNKQFQDTFSSLCYDYLMSQKDNWTSVGDSYYWNKCNDENPLSEASLEVVWREATSGIIDYGLIALLVTVLILVISLISKWIFVGKVSR